MSSDDLHRLGSAPDFYDPIVTGLPMSKASFVAFLNREADKAGFGIANGIRFEPFPGMEQAASDHMLHTIKELTGE